MKMTNRYYQKKKKKKNLERKHIKYIKVFQHIKYIKVFQKNKKTKSEKDVWEIYQNLPEEQKQKLLEYVKNYYTTHNK